MPDQRDIPQTAEETIERLIEDGWAPEHAVAFVEMLEVINDYLYKSAVLTCTLHMRRKCATCIHERIATCAEFHDLVGDDLHDAINEVGVKKFMSNLVRMGLEKANDLLMEDCCGTNVEFRFDEEDCFFVAGPRSTQ